MKYIKTVGCLITTAAIAAALSSCNRSQGQSASNGNLAPVDQNQQAAEQNQQQPYTQAQPPAYPQQTSGSYNSSSSYYGGYDTAAGYDAGAVEAEATAPPPPLPEYSQPPCPGDNYIWTPGYWSYADTGYYWVPGTWVLAPWVGALWTPPYWAAYEGHYRLHRGFWAHYIGFYGGIDYGFGYVGRGFYGGYWNGGAFRYNRAVTNVNVAIVHNVYNERVNNITNTRVSFNGPGGVVMRPTAPEIAVLRDQREMPVAAQVQHVRDAALNRQQFAAVNRGRPAIAAAPQPLRTEYRAPAPNAPAMRNAPAQSQMRAEMRPNERPEVRPGAPENRTPQEQQRPVEQPRGGFRANSPVPPAGAPAARPFAPERQVPQARPQPPAIAQQRREPERATQQNRIAPVPAIRQAPENRPMPQPRPAPAPQARPEARPMPEMRSAPAARPVPAPQARPEARPMPEMRPAPAARPAPAPQARPEARPAPAPQARPAAPAARPAPGPGENRRDEKGRG